MNYAVADIARILDAANQPAQDFRVTHILLDSRKLYEPGQSLFFALRGPRRDGHQFIGELYRKGVRAFVVSQAPDESQYPGAVFLQVTDSLQALQALASWHRSRYDIPVIGITGSNGKTIVKEWLYQLLDREYHIVRSPKSYNSQIGVPLSVLQMEAHHTLAIFEAGISEQGEMPRLERIIQPTLGILTNIGEAHSEGFTGPAHKLREKITLFRNCHTLIGRSIDLQHNETVSQALDLMGSQVHTKTWGPEPDNTYILKGIVKSESSTMITIGDHSFRIPFTDDASVENAITCYAVLRELGIEEEIIRERMMSLHPVNMRLELKKGINQCIVINDSYSTDISSLEIALGFLDQQSAGSRKTVILSDFLQSALPDDTLYQEVAKALQRHQVNRVIGIGERISRYLPGYLQGASAELLVYPATLSFTEAFRFSQFRDEAILVKGARVFEFERVVQLLEQKAHQTVLEINLSALAHNLKEYQHVLRPTTRVMAMVKAFAYGSGGAEIAGILQYHKADYLGVAYADEGVELRRAGIQLPVMIMNPEEHAFEKITAFNLEPDLFSFEILQAFDRYLREEGIQHYPVHLEIETGMNRLGFATDEINRLVDMLRSTSSFSIQSVFTHLAASEEAANDPFTQEQFRIFQAAADTLQAGTGSSFLRHIANSAAAIRHPDLQLDMIRLGIGLYGVDSSGSGRLDLQTVATLKASIAQVKKVKKGESVSYNRKGIVGRDALIATIRLGYADGFPRRLGNGRGRVWIRGQLVPVIGTVCMDMFMADVTDIPGVKEGEEVIIFGKEYPVESVARDAGTIPYEIMTGISQRVKRVYYQE